MIGDSIVMLASLHFPSRVASYRGCPKGTLAEHWKDARYDTDRFYTYWIIAKTDE